jgi:WD40 repeat protein
MATKGAGAPARLKVFISYSRIDEDFAQELLSGLELGGFEPYLDKHDIAAGEDWQARLSRLIEGADTVVFVISPDAVASERCAWEVERTVSLKKRLLPVVWRRVEEAQVPPRLKQLNYIYFDKPLMSVPSLTTLSTALRTDLAWIREHTRIGEAAFRWDGRGRNEALLFRGEELAAAKVWLASPPQYAPEPTLLHHEFIKAADDAETARSSAERQRLEQMAMAQEERSKAISGLQRASRRILALAVVMLLAVASGMALAIWQSVETEKREITVMTSLAQRAIMSGHFDRAMRIALQGLPLPGALPWSLGWSNKEVRGLEAKLAGSAQLSSLLLQLSQRGDVVTTAAFSPDDRRIVTASHDGTARIWDATSGSILHELKGHNGPITSAAISRDGRHIVTGSLDKAARIWDAFSGQQLREIKTGAIWSVAFSPDGDRFLTGDKEGVLAMWEVATGKLLATIRAHGNAGTESEVTSAAFSPDGTRIVTSSHDSTVQLRDATTLQEKGRFDHPGWVGAAAFDPSGGHVVTGSEDAIVRVLNSSDLKLERELRGHRGEIRCVSYSPDGRHIASGSSDSTVRLWNAATGELERELKGHHSAVTSVAFSADGLRIVTGSEDGSARVWDPYVGDAIRVIGNPHTFLNLGVSPDGSQLAIKARGSNFALFSTSSGEHMLTLKTSEPLDQGAIAFSPTGRHIATGAYNNDVLLWNVGNGDLERKMTGHTGTVMGVAFSQDGNHLFTGSADGTIGVWNAKDGARERVIKGLQEKPITSLAISTDGRRIVTGSLDQTAKVWDPETGELLRTLQSQSDVYSVAFSPDGLRVIAGSTDGLLRTWDSETGGLIWKVKAHDDWIVSLAFSHNGRRIVSGSLDHSVRVWDAVSGELLRELLGHQSRVWNVFFSSDGRHIFSGSDRDVRVWDSEWLVNNYEDALVRGVCSDKLLGERRIFNNADEDDPILRGKTGVDVCSRTGPLAPQYWAKLLGSFRRRANTASPKPLQVKEK